MSWPACQKMSEPHTITRLDPGRWAGGPGADHVSGPLPWAEFPRSFPGGGGYGAVGAELADYPSCVLNGLLHGKASSRGEKRTDALDGSSLDQQVVESDSHKLCRARKTLKHVKHSYLNYG